MIAIVVALSVSTFLLGFAALAVDLGSAYVRKAELQSIANRLALAGAKGLPVVVQPEGAIDEINRTLDQICRSQPTPGVCDINGAGDGGAPDPGWMTDGDPGNGEVTFYSDPDGDTQYALADKVTDLAVSTVATALQVKLAPSTVEFGFASAIGADSATLTKSATSRVGTPLGSGILPFALQPGDLTAGQFCVRDPAFGVGPGPGLPTPPLWPVILSIPPGPFGDPQYPDGVAPDTAGQFLDIKLTAPPSPTGSRLGDVFFHFTNAPDPVPGTPLGGGGGDIYRIELPQGAAGTTTQVWATGQERTTGTTTVDFVSNPETIFYTGAPAAGGDPCQQPSANRGFVKLARPGTGTELEDLEDNIRSGPAVKLVPVDGLAGTLGSELNCVSTAFSPATTCLALAPGVDFDDALTSGLLGAAGGTPGRLVGDCGNGTTGLFGVDDSRLFEDPGFINTAKGGSAAALQDRLSEATAPDPENRGWLTSHLLECPRLAVLPVIDPASSVGGIGGKNITSFRYVWIDDETSPDRGLHFTAGLVDSFRGTVIDPGYLPAVVAGSRVNGPFLGSDMPKQVQLIPDLGGTGG